MTFPLSFYLVSAAAIFLTGLSKSGFGGGLGVVSVPALSLFVEPQFAVAVLMPILIGIDVLVVWQYRHSWRRDVVFAMLPGALFGLAVGLATFRWMNADLIRVIVGLMALTFVAHHVLARVRPKEHEAKRQTGAFVFAAISGFASYVAHAGGPPVKGYLLRQRMDKSTFVGTNTMFFFSMNALKTVSYTLMGLLSFESLMVSLSISPVLLLGVLAGTYLHKHVDQRLFTALVYGFLTLAGAKLLSDSVISVLAHPN
ncbi:sulfite exporter TauE/SafE family protein [Roseibium sp.]|uniref:sulfite exporter TauE/SafE family protein n=1 Tax=Roseibium sp. TaxID=1936156 RepID=UPI003B50F894